MKLINIFLILIFFFMSVPARELEKAYDEVNYEIVSLGVEANFLDIESDANNVVHIVWWRQGSPFYGQIKNNEIINKESIPGLGYVVSKKFKPRFSVKPDGTEVHFVYTQKDSNATEIKHAWRDSDGNWHVKQAYKKAGKLVQYPSCAVDNEGIVHITFTRYTAEGGSLPVMYLRKVPGGIYKEMDIVSLKILKNKWPDIYNDKKGNIHLVWSIDKSTLHYRTVESGGDLSKTTRIDLPVREEKNKQPDIFVDEEDNVHVASLSYPLPGNLVYIDHFDAEPPATSFSRPTHTTANMFAIHAEYHTDPVVAAKNRDLVYVAWAQGTADHLVRKVRMSIKRDGEWALMKLDDEATIKQEGGRPASAMTRNRVYIVWTSKDHIMKMYTESIGYGSGITLPADGDNVCGPIVDIEANMDPETISSVEFFADGESLGTSDTEPFSIKWDASEATLGQHNLSIIATKTDGSTENDDITVKLNCPPELSIINLVEGACVSGTVDIELYANDDTDNLDKVELYIDGKRVRTFNNPPYSYGWNTSNLSSGNHKVKAIAYETGGQTSTDAVTVSKCPVYQPLNLTGEFSLKQTIFFKESSAVLNWEENPANSSVAEYRIYRILRGKKELAQVVDNGTFTFKEVIDESVEVLAYAVTTVDNSGNESVGAFVVLEKF